jgi:hypothetical protein
LFLGILRDHKLVYLDGFVVDALSLKEISNLVQEISIADIEPECL